MESRYIIEKQIGSGSFGKVFKIIDTESKRSLVMKRTPLNTPGMKEYIEQEMDHQKTIRSFAPKYINYSICEFKEIITEELPYGTVETEHSALILPYCDSGELEKYVISKGFLSERETKVFAFQIITALDFCHKHSIIHRDLKLENVMLNRSGEPDNQLTCYLCDFGCAKKVDKTGTIIGTKAYMAPEIFRNYYEIESHQTYDSTVDIWSFGIMIFRMLCGILPLSTPIEQENYLKAKKIEVPAKRNLSLSALSFMECCLQHNPLKRKPISELMQHEFITSAVSSYFYSKSLTTESKPQCLFTESFEYTEQMSKTKSNNKSMLRDHPDIDALYQWSLYSN
jgi:serine/threonine protein kinase